MIVDIYMLVYRLVMNVGATTAMENMACYRVYKREELIVATLAPSHLFRVIPESAGADGKI